MWESWLSGKGLRALSLPFIRSPDLAGSVSTLSPGTGLGPLSPEPGLNRGEEVADKGSFVHPDPAAANSSGAQSLLGPAQPCVCVLGGVYPPVAMGDPDSILGTLSGVPTVTPEHL